MLLIRLNHSNKLCSSSKKIKIKIVVVSLYFKYFVVNMLLYSFILWLLISVDVDFWFLTLFLKFYIYLPLYIVRVPSFLSYNDTTVRRGLIRYLCYVWFSFKVIQKNTFNWIPRIFNVCLRFQDLIGSVRNSCFNSWLWWSEVLNNITSQTVVGFLRIYLVTLSQVFV